MYFIRLSDRMTRTWQAGMLPVARDSEWVRVTSGAYDAFRRETKGMTPAALKKLRQKEAA
jgi:hypothetical protein